MFHLSISFEPNETHLKLYYKPKNYKFIQEYDILKICITVLTFIDQIVHNLVIAINIIKVMASNLTSLEIQKI